MLWRVRTTLPDRPGALAALAQRCGGAGVNILALQIFPGVEAVTDELVLRAPCGWAEADVATLVESAGGGGVVARPCTEEALVDQPTRYVQAARTILERPMSFPEVVARLFDAEPDPVAGEVHDTMETSVGDVQVQVHRTAPFTATEHARAAALADLVGDVLRRSREQLAMSGGGGRRMGEGVIPDYVVSGDSVTALVGGTVAGVATVHPVVERDLDGGDVRPVSLQVDATFQRRGIGTRLLVDSARLAHMLGAAEILLTTRADNQAVMPMVLAAGLRGRIRMAGELLTVRVPVRDLKPLKA
jgi:ribosomal protein S18 acetylase RimI-like enzyme